MIYSMYDLVGDKDPVKDEAMRQSILQLFDVVTLAFLHVHTERSIQKLCVALDQRHDSYSIAYPDNVTPSMHMALHLPQCISRFGPAAAAGTIAAADDADMGGPAPSDLDPDTFDEIKIAARCHLASRLTKKDASRLSVKTVRDLTWIELHEKQPDTVKLLITEVLSLRGVAALRLSAAQVDPILGAVWKSRHDTEVAKDVDPEVLRQNKIKQSKRSALHRALTLAAKLLLRDRGQLGEARKEKVAKAREECKNNVVMTIRLLDRLKLLAPKGTPCSSFDATFNGRVLIHRCYVDNMSALHKWFSRADSLQFVRAGSLWAGAYTGAAAAVDGAASFLALAPGSSTNQIYKISWDDGTIAQTLVAGDRIWGDGVVMAVDETRGLLVWAFGSSSGSQSGLFRCSLSDCQHTTTKLGIFPPGQVPSEMRWYDADRISIHFAGSTPVLRNIWKGTFSIARGFACVLVQHGPIIAPDGHTYYSCGSDIYRDAELLVAAQGDVVQLEYDARDNRVFWIDSTRWLHATTKGPGKAIGLSFQLSASGSYTGLAARVPKELLTMPCTAGSEVGGRGCQKCRLGSTDNDSSSATPCSECASVSYMDQVGQTGECKTCPAGKYLGSSWGPCLPCPAETYAPAAKWKGNCLVCQIGRYLVSSAGPCVGCPAGTSDDDFNTTTQCLPCASGTYTDTANNSGPCFECRPGNYLASTSGPCTQCGLGYTDHDYNSSTRCAKCDPGHMSPSGRMGPCVLCAAGRYLNSSLAMWSGPCITCAAGNVFNYTRLSCTACPAGSTDADSNAATACTLCVTCATGSFLDGQGKCSQCPSGTTDRDSNVLTQCESCPAGRYSIDGWHGECVVCGPGSFLDRATGSCAQCPAGTTDNDSNAYTACQSCGADAMSPPGWSSECVQCSNGSFFNTTTATCTPCPFGTTDRDMNISTACEQCGAQTYTPHSRSGECEPCTAGSYYDTQNLGCQQCPGGSTDNDSDVFTPCVPCPDGFSSKAGSTTQCVAVPCTVGAEIDTTTLSCVKCPAGTSDVDSNAKTACQKCPDGSFSTEGAAGNCTPCPSGSEYSLETGVCRQCQQGTTDEDRTAGTACVQCPVGLFSGAGHAGACIECSAGSEWAAATGTCLKCSAGFTDADSNASTPCALCSAGSHTAEGHSDVAAGPADSVVAYGSVSWLKYLLNCSDWTPPSGSASDKPHALYGGYYLWVFAGIQVSDKTILKVDWESGAVVGTVVAGAQVSGDLTALVVDEARGVLVWAQSTSGSGGGLYRCNVSDCAGTTVQLGAIASGRAVYDLRWWDADRVAMNLGVETQLWNVRTGASAALPGAFACSPTRGPVTAPDGHVYYACTASIYRDAALLVHLSVVTYFVDYDARQNRLFWMDSLQRICATAPGPGSSMAWVEKMPSNGRNTGLAARLPAELRTMRCLAGSEMGPRGCQKCRLGTTDNDSSAATPCSDCPGGTFMNETGKAGECTACPAGTHLGSSWGPCLQCSRGTYAPTAKWKGSCLVCPPGHYLASSAGPCTACPAGTSDADSDSTTQCAPCPSGTYTASANTTGSCTTCAPGNWLSSSTGPCTPCGLGYTDHDNSSATKCTQCGAAHTAPSTHVGPCVLCPGGNYLNRSRDSCEACKPGTRDTDNSSVTPCVPCANGTGSPDTGATGECPACQRQTTDHDHNPATACQGCSTGTFAPAMWSGSCITCAAGNVFNYTSLSCTACPAGTTDADSDASTPCVQCTTGTSAPAGWHGSCVTCAVGSFLNGQGQCTKCLWGTTDRDSNVLTPCQNCTAGRYSNDGHWGECVLCGAGSYLDKITSVCVQCPAGTTDDDKNAYTACKSCNETATSPPGWSSECIQCTHTGSYFHYNATSAICTPCPFGTTDRDLNISTPCEQCAAQTYTPHSRSGECQPCTAGSYYDRQDLECSQCSAGTTDNDSDIFTQCITCPEGHFSKAGSTGECAEVHCDPGSEINVHTLSCDTCDMLNMSTARNEDLVVLSRAV
eukprot:m51a1_g911 putative protein serine threonine (1990) ;mRNA; r:121961-132457